MSEIIHSLIRLKPEKGSKFLTQWVLGFVPMVNKNSTEVQGALAIKTANLSYEEVAVVPTTAFDTLH